MNGWIESGTVGFKVHSYGYVFESLLVTSKNLYSGKIYLSQTIISKCSHCRFSTETSRTQQQQVPEHVRKQ